MPLTAVSMMEGSVAVSMMEDEGGMVAAAGDLTKCGYSHELFTSPVPDDFICGVCTLVARDPQLTVCCGGQFCVGCIRAVAKVGQPCPSCRQENVSYFVNRRDQRRIDSLEVHCTMKERGCGWKDKLELLAAHLDVAGGNCQYVDIECPNKCTRPVQRNQLAMHLAKECDKRDHFCPYCSFKASYEAVCNDHWQQCPLYPIPCPNGCGIMAIERASLDAHRDLCSLEEVDCEFNYAGCSVGQLTRNELESHMKANVQRHLVLANRALKDKLHSLREEMEQKLEARDKAVADLVRRLEASEKQTKREARRVDDALRQIQTRVAQLGVHMQQAPQFSLGMGSTPYSFVVNKFEARRVNGSGWQSPCVCTHPNGYEVYFEIWPNGLNKAEKTHVSVRLCKRVGANDDHLRWPADCTIVLQLVNQRGDGDHFTVTGRFQWQQPASGSSKIDWFSPLYDCKFIPHKHLKWNTSSQTQYLMDDSLHFRIVGFKVHS